MDYRAIVEGCVNWVTPTLDNFLGRNLVDLQESIMELFGLEFLFAIRVELGQIRLKRTRVATLHSIKVTSKTWPMKTRF